MEFREAADILKRRFGDDLLAAMQIARSAATHADLTVEEYDAYRTVHQGMSKLFEPKKPG